MRIIIVLLALCIANIAKSQTIDEFKVDLKKLYIQNFPDSGINRLFEKHYKFLNWFTYSENNDINSKNEEFIGPPLAKIINDSVYQNTINRLTQDTSTQKKLLASALICAVNDTSRILFITSLVKTNDIKYLWACDHHILMNPKELNIILDYLLSNKDFEYAYHYLPFFFSLDPSVLEDFAYKNFYSSDPTIQYLAIHSIKYSPLTPEKEIFLKESVQKFDLRLKGWGMALLEYFNVPKVKDVVSPYIQLDTLSLEEVSIRALAASPTPEDIDYLYNYLLSQDSIGNELSYLLNSKFTETVKNGIRILKEISLKNDIYLDIKSHSLLYHDDFLASIHSIVKQNLPTFVKYNFINILGTKHDSLTNKILLSLLDNSSPSIREMAARVLKNNPSKEIEETIIKYATSPIEPNLELVDYLINNNIDTLQDFYYKIYTDDNGIYSSYERDSQAFKYLATFPKTQYKHLFIETLDKKDFENYSTNRSAAQALGKIKAIDAIDLIIVHLNKEREGSDSNCYAYIEALSNLKTTKSLEIIASFKNSEETHIKNLATKIIENW